jgi:hypothetical protein
MEQPVQKKPFPWGWAALGCGVVVLAALVVVFGVLVITRVLPSMRTAISNGTPLINPVNPPILNTPASPSSNPGTQAPGDLPFTISAVNDPTTLGTQSLMDAMSSSLNLNNDTDFMAPKKYTGKASLDPNSSFTVGNGWCAKDTATLKDNLSKMQYTFSINGKEIDLSKYPTIFFTDNQGHSCAITGISITPNANISGSYEMVLTQKYLKSLDDGLTSSSYPAGDVTFDFTIDFKGSSGPGINL